MTQQNAQKHQKKRKKVEKNDERTTNEQCFIPSIPTMQPFMPFMPFAWQNFHQVSQFSPQITNPMNLIYNGQQVPPPLGQGFPYPMMMPTQQQPFNFGQQQGTTEWSTSSESGGEDHPTSSSSAHGRSTESELSRLESAGVSVNNEQVEITEKVAPVKHSALDKLDKEKFIGLGRLVPKPIPVYGSCDGGTGIGSVEGKALSGSVGLSNSLQCNSSNSSPSISQSGSDEGSNATTSSWTDLDKKVLHMVVAAYTIKPNEVNGNGASNEQVPLYRRNTNDQPGLVSPTSQVESRTDVVSSQPINLQQSSSGTTDPQSNEASSGSNSKGHQTQSNDSSRNSADDNDSNDNEISHQRTEVMEVEKYDGQPVPHDVVDWEKVATHFSRDAESCRRKWYQVKDIQPQKLSHAWKARETFRLKELIKIFGADNWAELASYMPAKTPVQCKERYESVLDPTRKRTPWTKYEINLLYSEQERLGNKWKLIAQKLPGRTKTDIKNFWHSHAGKRALRRNEKASNKRTCV